MSSKPGFFLMLKRLLFIPLILLFLCPYQAHSQTHDLPQITVLAASSISEPLTEIARIYSRQKNIIVTTSFDGTAELARKIEQGEQADIFISAHPQWMTDLKQKGLLDVYSLTNLVHNKLALVISTKSSLNKSIKDGNKFSKNLKYLNNRTIMVMGDLEDSALGLYTKQAIQNTDIKEGTNLWGLVPRKIIPSLNAKNALYLISHGETAGIVYHSDAYNNKEVKILNVIDSNLHRPIIYQASVVAGESMSLARDFLVFLQSEQAKEIYKKYGFIVE